MMDDLIKAILDFEEAKFENTQNEVIEQKNRKDANNDSNSEDDTNNTSDSDPTGRKRNEEAENESQLIDRPPRKKLVSRFHLHDNFKKPIDPEFQEWVIELGTSFGKMKFKRKPQGQPYNLRKAKRYPVVDLGARQATSSSKTNSKEPEIKKPPNKTVRFEKVVQTDGKMQMGKETAPKAVEKMPLAYKTQNNQKVLLKNSAKRSIFGDILACDDNLDKTPSIAGDIIKGLDFSDRYGWNGNGRNSGNPETVEEEDTDFDLTDDSSVFDRTRVLSFKEY